MRFSPFFYRGMGCALLLAVISGCPAPAPERTNNQGGGSMVTVAAKILSDPGDPPIGQFNADEWQVVADNLTTIAGMIGVPLPAEVAARDLSDEEAEVIVDFLQANGVANMSDLTALAQQVGSGEVELPQTLIDLAVAMGFHWV